MVSLMAEDLLDYWVRLIRPVFPAGAWITSCLFKDDHLIQVDWKLKDDLKNPNKRSKKIEIIIKECAIEAYLNKNKEGRELSDILLKEFVCEQYNHLIPDNDLYSTHYMRKEKWSISKDVLDCKKTSLG